MNPAAKQKFSKLQFSIITGMHLLAIGGLFFYSFQACLVWLIAHIFFGMVGASLGLHRLFSHRSFEAHPALEKIIAVTATLCFQGGPIFWAAAHRIHHKMSEKHGDPYNAQKGFFWSHIGWLFFKNPNGFDYTSNLKNVSDLRKSKFITWLELNSTTLNFAFLAILFIVSFYFNRLDLFFWLGPIRVVSVWHSTWLINSYAHKASIFNKKPLISYRNSYLMCFLIGGDGFHDYHHKYPATPKHAPGKFHLDFGFYFLQLLSLINLVKIKKTEYER
jgi:fatty-acid desaturase